MGSLFLLTGCGDGGDSFSLLSDTNTFQQAPGSTNDKIDILWVVDNSGSMQTSQQNIADNFNAFIQTFQTKNLNFRMAFTATDAYRKVFHSSATGCAPFRDGALRWISSNCSPISGNTYSGVKIITPLTPNLNQTFVTNVLQGTLGSGDERAFQSMRVALEDNANANFLRDEAFLSVIMIGDEDDASHGTSTNRQTTGYNDPNNPNLHSIATYTNFLDTYTGSSGDTRRYSVSAIGIFDSACLAQLLPGSNVSVMTNRLGAMADATGGVKGSLCGNFATELSSIADNVLSLATQFYLTRIPKPETIVVVVNGQVIPRLGTAVAPMTGGWEYNASSNSVRFYGDYIPSAGSVINVTFDPVAYGS
jgi:hypothetical protein